MCFTCNGGDLTITEKKETPMEKEFRVKASVLFLCNSLSSALLCVGFVFGLVFLVVASAKSSRCHRLPYPKENISDLAFQAGVLRSTLNGLAQCPLQPPPQLEDWKVLIDCACQGPCLEPGWAQCPLRLTSFTAERWTPERKLRAVRKGGGGR